MKKYLLLAIMSTVIAGCAAPDIFNEKGSQPIHKVKDGDMIGATHRAADALTTQAGYLKTDLKPVLITSVANITNLNTSSAFGLMVSEQIGSRISQFGFPVVDVRTRKDIKVREKTGEFMLSRDIRKISRQHAAGAVLMGTYAAGRDKVFVSTRLVRPEDNRILASYDFYLPMGPDVSRMVRKKTR
ncbi:MAG: hypothetical protein CR975_00660 [Gammaproteobacteria bacterium]|nr:MAG: hypothetical protein CR975_00660 [Gammaproteobacteria bacterium]